MYKILVVDDEPIAVESVDFMIRRNFNDQFQIKTCTSGKQAVEICRWFYPDIVIMDVDMPGISGLEAIRQIREQNNLTVFVILSAYDYFDYAQEALKLGVADYILKPMSEERLIKMLDKLLEKLETQQSTQQQSLEQQEKLLKSIPVLESTFCHMLKEVGGDTEKLEKTCELLGYRNSGGYVILLKLNASTSVGKSRLVSLFHRMKRICECILSMDGQVLCVYVFDECGEQEIRERQQSIVESILECLRGYDIAFCLGVGRRYDTLEGAKKSFWEAHAALDVLSSKGCKSGGVLYQHDIVLDERKRSALMPGYMEEYVYTSMEQEDPAAVVREYDKYFETAKQQGISFEEVKRRIADIEVGFGKRFDVPSEETRAAVERILNAEHFESLSNMVRDFVIRTAAMLEMRKRKKNINIVEHAEAYIQEHYAESISLDDVARHVNLSQHYFSRFFKHEKGVGFTDYLTKVRIDHAIELLFLEELSIKEIAYMVGFNDPNYFFKIFKKTTGFTPGEYKSSPEGGN